MGKTSWIKLYSGDVTMLPDCPHAIRQNAEINLWLQCYEQTESCFMLRKWDGWCVATAIWCLVTKTAFSCTMTRCILEERSGCFSCSWFYYLLVCFWRKSIAPGFFLLRIRLILRYICKWCGHVAHTMTELNLHKADVHAMPPFTAKSDRDRVSWNLLILL